MMTSHVEIFESQDAKEFDPDPRFQSFPGMGKKPMDAMNKKMNKKIAQA